jgi:hypothetical protein
MFGLVAWDMRNRWSNCLRLGIELTIWSHIYRKENVCADKLASLGHAYANLRWWSSLPPTLRDVFSVISRDVTARAPPT